MMHRFVFILCSVALGAVACGSESTGGSEDNLRAGPSAEQQRATKACENKACGASCKLCAPNDKDCVESQELKACNSAGSCTSVIGNGPICGDAGNDARAGYNPCAGKRCGDLCQVCPPNDSHCVETQEIKVCTSSGACVSDTGNGPVCNAPDAGRAYDPCAGKHEGDLCTLCAPSDTDCVETQQLKVCNAQGRCTSDLQ